MVDILLKDSQRRAMFANRNKAIKLTNEVLHNSNGLSNIEKLDLKKIIFNSVMNKKPRTEHERKIISKIKYHQGKAFDFATKPIKKGTSESFALRMANYHQEQVRKLSLELQNES